MATIPKQVTLTNASVNVINAIKNSASINYQNYVPYATPDADSIRQIGSIIMDYPALQNEFINALINRIGLVVVTSKIFYNPWSFAKKGYLENGESIEEIFVKIAEAHTYDPETAESEVYKREKPDVASAFHIMNFQKFYKVTISENDLQKAFLSWSGVTDLINRIVDSIYAGAYYDEFTVMKYLIAKRILSGEITPINVTGTDMKKDTTKIIGVSNAWEFPSNKYNAAKVVNFTPKNEQYLIMDSTYAASMDVEVLATAFNMDKAEFAGHRILVDGFNTFDLNRLKTLVGDTAALNSSDLNTLSSVKAVMVGRDFFQIYDHLNKFTENYNGQGLYWNYFYHVWKTISASPFEQAAFFTTTTPSVSSVTVSPTTATMAVGDTKQMIVAVVAPMQDKSVTWSSDNAKVTVDARGYVTIGTGATGTANIKATSAADSSKSGTCKITIS